MATPVLLEAEALCRQYPTRGLRRAKVRTVAAVDGVSLQVNRNETFAVVGESGAGKSTLARLLLALERPDSGVVRFDGAAISELAQNRVRPLRRRFQAVFQDTDASLNPHLSIATSVAEPLLAHRLGSGHERRDRVRELLQLVGFADSDIGKRLPAALSGGERQRVAIARAIATEPELLLLDEPLSSLDVSSCSQLLDLLHDLRERLGLALVLISHDLTVVRRLCERVAIMLQGRFVEQGPTATVLSSPAHPYTRQLLAAAPVPDPSHSPPQVVDRARHEVTGGCRFRGSCNLADEQCRVEPCLREVAEGHTVACWK